MLSAGGLLFFALICWGSVDGAVHAWTSNEYEGEAALRVLVWQARFVLILGTFVAAFSCALLLVQHLGSLLRGSGAGADRHRALIGGQARCTAPPKF